MPDLQWDKTDFIECLGVLPETEEYETYWGYTVERQGLVLLVTVRPFESVIEARLRREGSSDDVIWFALLVEGKVELKREKWGNYLRLGGCRVVADRFYYMREGGAAQVSHGKGVDVDLVVDPDVRIAFN